MRLQIRADDSRERKEFPLRKAVSGSAYLVRPSSLPSRPILPDGRIGLFAHPTGLYPVPRIVAESDTSYCRVAVVSQFELSIG
jgi:hypothetical protein